VLVFDIAPYLLLGFVRCIFGYHASQEKDKMVYTIDPYCDFIRGNGSSSEHFESGSGASKTLASCKSYK
jgi:hypothetical protein